MKVIKKLFVLVITLIIITFSGNVLALENDVYYTNDHYVSFTKEEYDFVSKFYFDGYQKIMNQEQYKYMIDNDLMNGEIKVKEIIDNDGLLPMTDTYYATGSKKIKLSSSCGSSPCSMAISLTWLVSPKVRSYDLIGAYSPTSDNLKFGASVIYHTGGTKQYTESRKESHGVSATMKLPSSGEDIIIVMDFKANKGTTVYAAYQHAKKTISLANSRKYSFNSGGYGHVFLFDESVSDYYDAMGGVQMTI